MLTEMSAIFLILSCQLKYHEKAENCDNAKINHIRFHGDFLDFELANFKVHKNREKHLVPWHVYVNP